jgi:hypothetical protein
MMEPTVGACEMKADFKLYVTHNLKHYNSDNYYCCYYNKEVEVIQMLPLQLSSYSCIMGLIQTNEVTE